MPAVVDGALAPRPDVASARHAALPALARRPCVVEGRGALGSPPDDGSSLPGDQIFLGESVLTYKLGETKGSGGGSSGGKKKGLFGMFKK